jgi:hypothetical protein
VKKRISYFIVLLLPMLIVSALINTAYSLHAYGSIELNIWVILSIAIILDASITWLQTRRIRQTESESEDKNP